MTLQKTLQKTKKTFSTSSEIAWRGIELSEGDVFCLYHFQCGHSITVTAELMGLSRQAIAQRSVSLNKRFKVFNKEALTKLLIEDNFKQLLTSYTLQEAKR